MNATVTDGQTTVEARVERAGKSEFVKKVWMAGTAAGLSVTLMAVASLFAAVVTIISPITNPKPTIEAVSADTNLMMKKLGEQQAQITQARNDVAQLQNLLVQNAPTDTRLALDAMSKRLDEIEKRQSSMDRIILDDPNKALTLPLIKRDIEQVRLNNETSVAAVKATVDMVYDINKYIVATILFGLAGIGVTLFATFRSKA